MPRATKDFLRTLGPEARILFIRLRSMGDCLLLTAPLRSLKQQFPGFRLSVLVEERFRDCFSRNPDLAEILTVPEGKYASLRMLIGRRFDAVVNLHGGPTSLIYACAVRGARIGIEDFQGRFLYSGLIPRGETMVHAVAKTLEWLGWMGLAPAESPRLRYAAHPEEAAWARSAVGGQPYVVIHPAALLDTKRWQVERFAAVGKTLQNRGWQAVVTAGPGEESLAVKLSADLPGSLMLLGLTIPQLAEIIRGAHLYLGNDSGPMHLAAAVGTPTVAVWGSSSSTRWGPWGIPHRIVENSFDCNPCAGYRCGVAKTPLCIESVSVDQVTQSVQDLLMETARPTPILQLGELPGEGPGRDA